MDCDSVALNMNTKVIINDLKKLEDFFDTSNLDENHEVFSNKIRKAIGKSKIETPKRIWIDDFIALRSKCYALEYGEDSRNKLNCNSKSQSKNISFEEYKVCLDGEENENVCSIFILESINHEMYMQEIKNSTLSIFEYNRNYLEKIQSLPWG